MIKNGLFLCSLGLLFFVYNANQNTGTYVWINMALGLVLAASGLLLFLKGSKREKELKKAEEKKKVK